MNHFQKRHDPVHGGSGRAVHGADGFENDSSHSSPHSGGIFGLRFDHRRKESQALGRVVRGTLRSAESRAVSACAAIEVRRCLLESAMPG
ncbi:MAG: hypothetical protein ACRES2_00690, partial [Steroidobacteraceae bacterium]